MEKFNYIDTLKSLNEDKLRLEAEIQLIEVAINALAALGAGTGVTLGAVAIEEKASKDEKDEKPQRKNYYQDTIIEIPEEFNSELSAIELLVYALNENGESTVDEAAEYILSLDSSKERKYILSRFRDIASGLYRAGKIDANTKRKKYKYSLKNVTKKQLTFDEELIRELDKLLEIKKGNNMLPL